MLFTFIMQIDFINWAKLKGPIIWAKLKELSIEGFHFQIEETETERERDEGKGGEREICARSGREKRE